MVASSEKLHFVSKCPTPGCNSLPSQEFARSDLEQRLKTGAAVRLSCIRCDQHWVAGPEEREGMRKLLKSR